MILSGKIGQRIVLKGVGLLLILYILKLFWVFSFFQYVCSFSHVDIIGMYNPGSQEDSGLPNY